VPNECDAPEISKVYVLRAPADIENLETALEMRHRPCDRNTARSQSKPEADPSRSVATGVNDVTSIRRGGMIVSHVANDCYDCSWRK
jgi:hypothetical protein